MSLLLDTHVLLWWVQENPRLSRAQKKAIRSAGEEDPVLVAGISLWEIGNLASLGRLDLHFPVRDWLERAAAPPLVRTVGITPAIAAEVAALPDSFHRDPADRIIVATARVMGATLLTQDKRILKAGLVRTL